MTGAEGAGAFGRATGRSVEHESELHQTRYRAYQLDLIRRHCGSSVLEVGAGLGEFASQLCGLERHVVTDVDPACVDHMRRRFAHRSEVEAHRLDLGAGSAGHGRPVATVMAINVLEHLEDDGAALGSMAGLAEPGGTIVIWVPGYMQLYGDFDRRVGHLRRYTPDTLRAAFVRAELEPIEVRPVNLLGGVAWWLAVRAGGVGAGTDGDEAGGVAGEGGRPSRARTVLVRSYDRLLVPVTRAVEGRVTPPFGQSVLGVARVPSP